MCRRFIGLGGGRAVMNCSIRRGMPARLMGIRWMLRIGSRRAVCITMAACRVCRSLLCGVGYELGGVVYVFGWGVEMTGRGAEWGMSAAAGVLGDLAALVGCCASCRFSIGAQDGAGLLCVAEGGGEEARETRARWRCNGFQYEPGALQ